MSALDRVEISRTVRAFLNEIRPTDPSKKVKLDYGFRFHGRSVELFDIRPRMLGKAGKIESELAKATFVKSREIWKVYWMRGNGRWYPYEPSTVRSLRAFLKLVREDERGCFFG